MMLRRVTKALVEHMESLGADLNRMPVDPIQDLRRRVTTLEAEVRALKTEEN